MTQTEQDERQEDLRRLLKDAIEVQLAALKAGISFWTEWIEQTGEFVNSATKTLASINAEDQQTKDVLLELVDAGRASMRSMTEIPRHSALRFIEELDRLREEQDAEAAAAKSAAKKTTSRATKSAAKKTSSKATKRAAKKATPKATRSAAKKTSSKTASASGTSAQRTSRSSRPRRAGRVKS